MSKYLDDAARLDPQRAADLARNDQLLAPRFAMAYGVTHTRPIVARGVHYNAANDARMVCTECTVCGGETEPGDNRLCDSCRGLAATFKAVAAREVRS